MQYWFCQNFLANLLGDTLSLLVGSLDYISSWNAIWKSSCCGGISFIIPDLGKSIAISLLYPLLQRLKNQAYFAI